MTLAGLLRQTVTITPVTWTGTTAVDGTTRTTAARVDHNHHTTESDLGDRIYSTRIAYLLPDPLLSEGDTITHDGIDYRAARITPSIDGAGQTHHLVVDLAPLGADTVTITRPATPGAWDPSTGIVNQSPATVIWTGPATINPSANPSGGDAVGQDIHTTRLDVAISHHTPDIEIGDIVTATVSTDPHLLGVPLRVDSISSGSGQYGQYLRCIDDRTNR